MEKYCCTRNLIEMHINETQKFKLLQHNKFGTWQILDGSFFWAGLIDSLIFLPLDNNIVNETDKLVGFTLVFGPPLVRLMCYFHVRKNIEPYYRALSKNARRQLQCDVQALQNCQDASTFLKAVPLFLKKWTAIHPDFVKYFREQWISKNYQWFEGAAVGQPSSNNGLEATNGVIKSEHTMRERLPVGQFLSTTLEIVLQWSETRDPESANCIEYATTPKVSLPQWTKAYQWAVEKSDWGGGRYVLYCVIYFDPDNKEKVKAVQGGEMANLRRVHPA